VIDAAMEEDASRYSAEYLATFRADIEAFVSRDAVDACVDVGVLERPPEPHLSYSAFVDPSGGSQDSFTLAIGHRESNLCVLDCLREIKPPFSPESVTAEFAKLLKSYRVGKVVGDRYAGEWPRERFAVHGIDYEPSAKRKSDIYRDCLPLLNGRRVSLLDHAKLINQLCGLERRTARGGGDTIDHAPGQHDDIANAVAGALVGLGDPYSAYTHALLNHVTTPRQRGAVGGIPMRSGNPWHHPMIQHGPRWF
jgi:hypothetical protein